MGSAVPMSRLWARARAVMPAFSARPFSLMYCMSTAAMPAAEGEAMEVPELLA